MPNSSKMGKAVFFFLAVVIPAGFALMLFAGTKKPVDPACFASNTLRIQVADRLFVVPREDMHAISKEATGNQRGRLCQKADDPPLETDRFSINPYDDPYGKIKNKPFDVWYIEISKKSYYDTSISCPVLYAKEAGKPFLKCNSNRTGQVPGNQCSVFFAWSNDLIAHYVFSDHNHSQNELPKLHKEIVRYIRNIDQTSDPRFMPTSGLDNYFPQTKE